MLFRRRKLHDQSMGDAGRLRALVVPLVALVLAGEAWGQALKGPALDACLAQPSAPCLLDLAAAERSAFRRRSARDEAFNRDRWLQQIAMAEIRANRLAQASSYLAQMRLGELRDIIIGFDGEVLPMPEGLDAHGLIARALEEGTTPGLRADETMGKSLDRRAEAAWLLLAFGHRGKAEAVLRSTANDFVGHLKAGDTEVLVAASTLMQALIALADPALEEQLARALTDISAGTGHQAEFYEEERLHALRDLRLARIRHQTTINPASIELELGDDDIVKGQVALAWTIAGDTAKAFDLLGRVDQQSQAIHFLVSDLLKRDRPDAALMVTNQVQSEDERSRLLFEICSYFAAKGQLDQAEALLDRITVPTERSTLLIAVAQRRADGGKIEAARGLLIKGQALLSQETEPIGKLMLTLDAAGVLITLGEPTAARQSVAEVLTALRDLKDETDPLNQFVIAVRAATLLAELGDGNSALDPISMVTPPGRDEDKVYGAILVAQNLAGRNRADLARAILLTTLRGNVAKNSVDHESWSMLFPNFANVWLAAEKAKGDTVKLSGCKTTGLSPGLCGSWQIQPRPVRWADRADRPPFAVVLDWQADASG